MAFNTIPKEVPIRDGNLTAGVLNYLDVSTMQREVKAFATLRATFALRGCSLHRTDLADGPVKYWVERGGLVCYQPSMHVAALFLTQIGGRA